MNAFVGRRSESDSGVPVALQLVPFRPRLPLLRHLLFDAGRRIDSATQPAALLQPIRVHVQAFVFDRKQDG